MTIPSLRPAIATLIALASAVTLRAQVATQQPTVEQLIERLGNRDFKAREAAAKALAVRAEEALPAMRKAITHPDPEVRQRLEQLVAETERATKNPRRNL